MPNIFLFIVGLTLLVTYCLLAAWPASFAYALVSFFDSKTYFAGKDLGYWQLFEKVKLRRAIALGLLAALIFLVGFLDFGLINRALQKELIDSQSMFGLFIGGIVIFFGYGLLQFFYYGKVRVPTTQHKREGEIKGIIENMSIVAGVVAPGYVILAHTTPTIFSLHANFKPTTVYITTGLLNLCSREELEAAVAHEIAYHLAKRNSNLRLLENLLLLLKLESFILMFLGLMNIGTNAFFLWLIGLVLLYIRTAVYLDNFSGENSSYFETLVSILNPPYLFSQVVAYVFYYSLSWQENIFADLKAVDLTRYPQGLYNLLEKLSGKAGTFQSLPKEFDHLYLTAECSQSDGLPDMQLSILERLAMLRRIDTSLIQEVEIKENIEEISCSFCGCSMKQILINNIYNRPTKCFYCTQSGHVWMDDGSFYYLTSPENLENLSILLGEGNFNKESNYEGKSLLCPRCGVGLQKTQDFMFPKEVLVFHCYSCQGDFSSLFSFQVYVYFRKTKELKA